MKQSNIESYQLSTGFLNIYDFAIRIEGTKLRKINTLYLTLEDSYVMFEIRVDVMIQWFGVYCSEF